MRQGYFANPLIVVFLAVICLYPFMSMSAPSETVLPQSWTSRLPNGVEGYGDLGYESHGVRTPFASTSDNTNIYRLPAGTVLYRSRRICAQITTPTPVNLFNGEIEFTTGPASTLVEIQYSGQASIAIQNIDNTLYVICSVSQDGGTSWTACSAQGINGIAVTRGTYSGSGNYFGVNTSAASYMGYVADLSPSTATKVKLEGKLFQSTPSGYNPSNICQNNVIIRY